MIFGTMFLQNDALGLAMAAAEKRDGVIANNIANADTPGFKKSGVTFEEYFAKALGEEGGRITARNASKALSARPEIYTEYGSYEYRIDGNNVDIESEMTELYKNGARYDTLVSGVVNNYKRLNLAITGIR
ncbi:MAG: flagellar basal body rod protein FlgB [Clostridiales bacterium]|nr:flagellar basal body rod protein FlgB [Clostridiales bacterium]